MRPRSPFFPLAPLGLIAKATFAGKLVGDILDDDEGGEMITLFRHS